MKGRNKLLAMVHIGAKKLFGDDRDAYEAFLLREIGKNSCAKASDKQIEKIVTAMQKLGGLEAKSGRQQSASGGKSYDRPTALQRAKLAALSRDMGWDGLNDPALFAFIKRTTRRDAMRFLTRHEMSQIITGLEKWRDQLQEKQNAMPELSV